MTPWERFVFITTRAAVLAYFEVMDARRLLMAEEVTDEDRARADRFRDAVRLHLSQSGNAGPTNTAPRR